MGDKTEESAEVFASIHQKLVKDKRAALFPILPRLLATYFLKMHGKQPQSFSNEVHEGKSALKTPVHISTGTEKNLPEGLELETNMQDNLPEGLEMETNMQDNLLFSLEGFFLWLDEEASEGEYQGFIERDPAVWIDFLKDFLRQPIGSGINGRPLKRMMCANQTSLRTCPFAASDDVACNICNLVKYCSNACVYAYAKTHQQSICRSLWSSNSNLLFPLQAEIMEAGRQVANHQRIQNLVCNPVLPSSNGLLYDVVRAPLIDNEGKSPRSSSDNPADEGTSSSPQNHPHQDVLPDNVRLLFPALYDLRNVFTTVRNIPDDYTGTISLFLNFAQAKLAVRDFLILELLRRHGAVAIDLAIGLWYSAAITATQDTHLMLTIVRMLYTWQSSPSATGNQQSCATYQQPFPSSKKGSSLQADFGRDIWSKLIELVSNDDCNRTGFNPKVQYAWGSNKDVEFKVGACHPTHLASWFNFEKNGLLLPYGAPKWPFNTPNRFRYSPSSDDIARYTNDPISGWDRRLLCAAFPSEGADAGDLYGVFFFQLREMMEAFVQKTASCCIRLHLMQFQIRKLFKILKNSGLKFNRIDACALDIDKDVSGEEAMQWCGALLAENASPAWPSLLLTATRRGWAEDMHEAYKKGSEMKKKLMSISGHIEFLGFWEAIEPLFLRAYARLFEDFPISRCDDMSEEHAAAQLGLHKQKRHRIVSPLPGVYLEHSWELTRSQAAIEYFGKDQLAYFNLVFSGFTFQERFHEWGWLTGH